MAASIGTGDKKSVNIELNIVPFIDLMSCLTAFLLVTAVWVNIAQINIQPKGKTRDQAQVQQDDEHVTLSVLVQSDKIWVGLSRVNEFQDIPKKADDQDWDKLETTLKEHKARVLCRSLGSRDCSREHDGRTGQVPGHHPCDGRRREGRLHRRGTLRPGWPRG